METKRQKSIVLILAREFASNLGMPMFVADAEGRLVFYNEPAEQIVGRTFAEAGEMSLEEWRSLLSPEALDGRPLPVEESPIRVAFDQHRPFHNRVRITGFDGTKREISSTAFPLLGREQEFLGIITIFWVQR